jgi:hypothetical protein
MDEVREVETIGRAVSMLLKVDYNYITEGIGLYHKELYRIIEKKKLSCKAPLALKTIKDFALSLPQEQLGDLNMAQYDLA